MKLIETLGHRQWLDALQSKYDLKLTELRETDNAFTVFLVHITPKSNILVGRFCRVTHVGVVLDRRGETEGSCLNPNTHNPCRRQSGAAELDGTNFTKLL